MQGDEPRAEAESLVPEGQPDAAPQSRQSDEKEEYEVRFAIRSVALPVLQRAGFPYTYSQLDEREEDRIWQALEPALGEVRTYFRNYEGAIQYTPFGPTGSGLEGFPRFDLQELVPRRGSITILAVLGMVYVGVKDYETIRKSLIALAVDLRGIIDHQLMTSDSIPSYSPRWEVDIDDVRGPAFAGASRPTSATSAVAPTEESLTPASSPRSTRRPDIGLVFTAYLVLTNVLLMGFIGFLLIRTLS